MLYFLLKPIIRLALKVFYRSIRINASAALPGQGPLIVVSNHPNTFMDPIIVAAMLEQPVYFLAKGTVFKSPLVSWLLHRMNMIPVYRKEDAGEGSATAAVDNRETFGKCFDFLARKGTLLIFPEGNSVNERRLRKLKTGTARIALGFEAERQFSGGLTILTVGLNYSQATRFRSEVLVNVGQPIAVRDWAAAYAADPFQAAHQLTESIRQQLEAHLIITRDEAEDRLVRHIETIYGTKLIGQADAAAPEEEFHLTKEIVEAVHFFERENPAQLQHLRQRLEDYAGKLRRVGLDHAVMESVSARQNSLWSGLGALLYLVLGFPLYLYGLVNNYIPYIIPSRVVRLLGKDPEYTAPLMMVTGIFSFSMGYAFLLYCFYQFTHQFGWTLLYALSLPLTGFLTLHYWNFLEASFHTWRVRVLFQRQDALITSLIRKRQEIVQELQQAQDAYLAARHRSPV